MGAFYGTRIRCGIITINDVPKFWKTKTEKWLEEIEEKVVPGSDEDVVRKFYAEQLAGRLTDFSHLNTQMGRFGNNF